MGQKNAPLLSSLMNLKSGEITDQGVKKRQRHGNGQISRKPQPPKKPIFHMEPLARIELATYSLRVNCSTPELQRLEVVVGDVFSTENHAGKSKNKEKIHTSPFTL